MSLVKQLKVNITYLPCTHWFDYWFAIVSLVYSTEILFNMQFLVSQGEFNAYALLWYGKLHLNSME